jgi:AcrR family transcriptional regulator
MKKKVAERLTNAPGQRGPAVHDRRAQILAVADEHFRRYGYDKTTVGDIARACDLSTAYLYRFFDSKQAIGEAICSRCLGEISDEVRAIASERKPAADRLRRMYESVWRQSLRLFFDEQKLHEIVNISRRGKWKSIEDYQASMLGSIADVVSEGRQSGEFEKSTPINETVNAVAQTFLLVWHPILLEEHFENLEQRAKEISGLVLRSLLRKLE